MGLNKVQESNKNKTGKPFNFKCCAVYDESMVQWNMEPIMKPKMETMMEPSMELMMELMIKL